VLTFASMMGSAPGALPQASAAPAAPVADGLATLQEFATFSDGSNDPRHTGYWFTANDADAAAAVNQRHFTKVEDLGLLHTAGAPGRLAVHRLRLKTGPHPSYMLSTVAAEIGSSAFADEGVIGWIDSAPGPGEFALMRDSYQNLWPATPDASGEQAILMSSGFQENGAIGFLQSAS